MPKPLLTSLLLLAAALSCGPAAAASRTHALLVGVSQYPSLAPGLSLEGPKNDVQLFHGFLQERGVAAADIRVLADGTTIAGAGLPTRKAILDGLAQLAQTAAAGDFVFLMFAGHGSQMPAAPNDPDEPDGLDEIFLPRDVGKWDGELGALPQAISDNEIGAAITRIRDRGAFVWAIFDNCHSGTMTRSAERTRQLRPADLGVPAAAMQAAQSRAVKTRGGGQAEASPLASAGATPAGRAGFVAFYAAQSTELAPETALPAFAPDAKPRGVFSYTLYEVLSTRPGATYRQVHEQVLQRYQSTGRTSVTPMIEGTQRDATTFGTSGTPVLQWRVDREQARQGAVYKVRAGLMHQVTQDSILALVPQATSKDTEVIGYVRVTEARSVDSIVVPVAHGGKPAPAADALKPSMFARPVELKVDFVLRVSAPVKVAGLCEAPTDDVRKLIQEVKAKPERAPRVRWVGANEPADVRLCQVAGGHLSILDAGGTQSADARRNTPGIAVPPGNTRSDGGLSDSAKSLTEALDKLGRVINLSRLAVSMSTSAKLDVELKLKRDCPPGAAAGCDPTPQTINPGDRPFLGDQDEVVVTFRNQNTQPVDVTLLYVDAQFGIQALFPEVDKGGSARVPAGGSVEYTFHIVPEPVGFERLMVIAVPVAPGSSEVSFVDLAQPRLDLTTRGMRGAADIAGAFEDAVFGPGGKGATRGVAAGGGAQSVQVTTWSWNVVAK
jgi:hypothetical protein